MAGEREMHVYINGEELTLPAGTTLMAAMHGHSPFGDEAVICKVNGGKAVRCVGPEDPVELHEGDRVEVFPLVIGG